VSYNWPGNVRELRNVVKRLALFAQDNIITANHALNILGKENSPLIKQKQLQTANDDHRMPLMALHKLEEAAIKNAMSFTNGNKSRAATILEIDYKTLLRKLKQYPN